MQALCGSIGGQGLAGFGAGAGGRQARRVVRRRLRGGRRRGIGARGAPHRPRADHRPVDLRVDGDRHGLAGRRLGERARRRSDDGQAQPRVAVHRSDRRRAGGLLHHHRAAVPGLPGSDRPPGPASTTTDLASMPGRIKRRDEFLAMVHDWAADKTTDEIIDLATAFRIPVAPIATPQTILSIDHFVERGVFVESEGGAVAPRVPYLSADLPVRGPAARLRWVPTRGRWRGERAPRPASAGCGRRTICRSPACGSRTSPRSGPDRWRRRCSPRSARTSSRSKGCAVPTECGWRAAVRRAGISGGSGDRSSCAPTPTSETSSSSSARRRGVRRRST